MELSAIMPTLDDARQTHDVLVRARDLIRDESAWCKGRLETTQGDLTQHCARGAIGKVCGLSFDYSRAFRFEVPPAVKIAAMPADKVLAAAAMDLFGELGGTTDAHVTVNNKKGHADVMMVFDRAIILAEKRMGELSEVRELVLV